MRQGKLLDTERADYDDTLEGIEQPHDQMLSSENDAASNSEETDDRYLYKMKALDTVKG